MFINNCEIFRSIKFFGKIIVQYNICRTGNKNVTENINIKAKTTDRLGIIGKSKALACEVISTLKYDRKV